jgi:NAD(P)-dependent dehydrogenase (short-subunit alcohol dehydrogenase family)
MLELSGGRYPNMACQVTKGAVVNMTRPWPIEWAPLHIRVNAVAPGPVRTPFICALTDQPALVAKFEQMIPLGRLAEVDDIAGPDVRPPQWSRATFLRLIRTEAMMRMNGVRAKPIFLSRRAGRSRVHARMRASISTEQARLPECRHLRL